MPSPNEDADEDADADPLASVAMRGSAELDSELDVEAFVEHLRGLHPEISREQAAGLHALDLAIAFSCGCGNPATLARFEEEYGADINRLALRRLREPADALDLAQRVRLKILFPPAEGGTPRISKYRGGGPLRAWVRVVASRMIVDEYRDGDAKAETTVEHSIVDALEQLHSDPGNLWMQDRYRGVVEAAMTSAFEAMSPKDRRLLRGLLIKRMSTDDLGARYGVHRTTAARWVEAARARLVERTHEELRARLGATNDDTMRSLVALVRSTVDVSVVRLLGSTHDE